MLAHAWKPQGGAREPQVKLLREEGLVSLGGAEVKAPPTTSVRKQGIRGVCRTQRGSSDEDKVGLTHGNAGSVSALTT